MLIVIDASTTLAVVIFTRVKVRFAEFVVWFLRHHIFIEMLMCGCQLCMGNWSKEMCLVVRLFDDVNKCY